MKTIVTFIIGLFCFGLSAQELLIVDTNTGKERKRDLSEIVDTSLTKVIPNLKSNLKVYMVVKEDRPSYDPLKETLNKTKTFTTDFAKGESYPSVVVGWEIVPLTDETIRINKQLQVINKEIELQASSVSDSKFKIEMSIAIAAIALQLEGKTLTEKQLESLEIVKAFGIKAYQNKQVKEKLLNDLETDPNADIKGNWVQ